MEWIEKLTAGDVIEIIAGIAIPVILFIVNKNPNATINEKLIFKSNKKRVLMNAYRILSYITLTFSIILFEYNNFLIPKETIRFLSPNINAVILLVLVIIGWMFFKHQEDDTTFSMFYHDDNSYILTVINILVMVIISILIVAIVYIGDHIMRAWIDFPIAYYVSLMLSSIVFFLSVAFSESSEFIKDNNAYVAKTIRIITNSNCKEYEIVSNIIEKKDCICFFYQTDSISKYIVIPKHAIARIEYLISEEQLVKNIKKEKKRKQKRKNKKT